MEKRIRAKKIKYFLGKWTSKTTLSEESFGHTESWHNFGTTVETKEEAEKWAETNSGVYAIKGRQVHFDIRRKVEVETTVTAIEED